MAGRKWMIQKNQVDYQRKEELEDLLVFGYSAKLFRDDEKARYLDEERHLIPWMGDTSLLIDRYDGRGHLYDLHEYDAANMSWNPLESLSEEERRVEALCDEERYLELRQDILEKQTYEEEELKRLNEALNNDNSYGAVRFNYDYGSNSQSNEDQQQAESCYEEEEPYECPPELLPPDGVMIPTTVKIGAVLEKTAEFISRQGAQMEIMLKMKQKDNPVFSFLDFTDPLNPFYKHVVQVIKSGKYRPKPQDSKRHRRTSEDEGHGGYLHPSLFAGNKQETKLPEISSKGFLESVKEKLPAGQIANTPYAQLVSKMTKHTQGRNSPLLSQKPGPMVQEGFQPMAPPPMPPFVGQHMGASEDHPPPPGMEPVQLPSAQPPPPGTVAPEQPSSLQPQIQVHEYHHGNQLVHGPHLPSQKPMMPSHVVPPPPDLQPIIDKMASYVAKNGIEFEMVVKAKNDARFSFLETWHAHYPYYSYKKDTFLQEIERENPPPAPAINTNVEVQSSTNSYASNKAVSFSIRTKEQEPSSLPTRTALLYDSSDDEDEEGKKPDQKESEDAGYSPEFQSEYSAVDTMEQQVERPEKLEKPTATAAELEKRIAEDRVKDKLASAAREKLAQTAKEEQLKAERKRKAAMFINMLKTGGGGAATHQPATASATAPGPQLQPQPEEPSVDIEQEIGPIQGPLTEEAVRAQFTASIVSAYDSEEENTSSVTVTKVVSAPKPRSPPRMDRLFRKDKRSRTRSPSPTWRSKPLTPPASYMRGRRSPPHMKIHSRSRSRSPRKERKLHRRSRSRSKSKSKSDVRSRSRSKSKAKQRRRSRSGSKSRSKDTDRSKRAGSKLKSYSSRRSKSRSPSKKKSKKEKDRSRSRSPSRKKTKKEKTRSKSRSRSPSKRKSHRDRSRSSSPSKKKSRKDKDKKQNRSDSRSPSRKSSRKDRKKGRSRSGSPKSVRSLSWEQDSREEGEVKDDDDVILLPGTPSPRRPEDVQDMVVSSTSEEKVLCEAAGHESKSESGTTSATAGTLNPEEASLDNGASEIKLVEEEKSLGSDSSPATNSPRSETKVSQDLLSKVRAMLKATREATMDEIDNS